MSLSSKQVEKSKPYGRDPKQTSLVDPKRLTHAVAILSIKFRHLETAGFGEDLPKGVVLNL